MAGTPYTLQFEKTDTLQSSMSSGATSFTLTSGNFGSPSGPQLYVIDYDVPASAEVVSATVASTAGTSVTRGLDGTSGVSHSAGAKVGGFFVPSHYNALKPHVVLKDAANGATANSTTFVSAGISQSLTTTGGQVIAVVSFSARTGTAGDFMSFRLKRDSTVLRTKTNIGGGSTANERYDASVTAIETPAAGAYTYDVEFNRASGGGTITVEDVNVLLIEVAV